MVKCYLVTAFNIKIRPKARLCGGAGADEDEPDALRREVRRERHERRELHLRVGKRHRVGAPAANLKFTGLTQNLGQL